MNIENLKSQMRKGMLEFCVLLLLRHGDAYASEIISRLKEAHMIVMEGTLYPLLTRLKNDVCSHTAGKNRPRGRRGSITRSHLWAANSFSSCDSRGRKSTTLLTILTNKYQK